MNSIFLIGIVQAVFFALLIFNKKEKSLADKVLGFWLLFIGLHLFMAYGDTEQWHLTYPHWLGLSWPFPIAEGPFFFLYVLALVRNPSHLSWKDFLHFVPFVFAYLISWEFYNLSGPEKLPYYQSLFEQPNLSYRIINLLIYITGPVYALYVLWRVRLHEKNIQELFSYTEDIDLKWIRNLALGMMGIWVVVWLSSIAHSIEGYHGEGGIYIFIAVTLFVFAIGYFGFKQTQIFVFSPNNLDKRSSTRESKYQKSGLKNRNSDKLLKRLMDFMETHKPYLQPKISLSELAHLLEISPHHLSQLLNEQLEQNFFEFINQYRVNAFKTALAEPKNSHLTLLAIAEDCGFNSKSSFNRIFKEMTSQTPSQYAAKALPGQ